jgi:hypothetical protein
MNFEDVVKRRRGFDVKLSWRFGRWLGGPQQAGCSGAHDKKPTTLWQMFGGI